MKVEFKLDPGENAQVIRKLSRWLDSRFPCFFFFLNPGLPYPHGGFKTKVLAGSKFISWDELENHGPQSEIAALVGYDYKNQVETLTSSNPALVDCPESLLMVPELTVEWTDEGLAFDHPQADSVLKDFLEFSDLEIRNPAVAVLPRESRDSYLSKLSAIQGHIEEGDIYELNFCQSFVFESPQWDPVRGFLDLWAESPMPFSALVKANDLYLISASPERFLKKSEGRLVAQPIKGTIRRGENEAEDELMRNLLLASEKERAENLMIVDLMRNDLAKVSEVGSVEVEELFGVYPFPKVHQMISTVQSVPKPNSSLREIFQATFPMGSMTGAPKIKCMELIERYENFRRGWFSGTLGVVSASGDFDFNVIIRSIVFDKRAGRGYFAVGSAITYDADPAFEYEECMLKASAILQVLTQER